MGKKGVQSIHTFRPHVAKLLDRRLGAKEKLECVAETSDLLMCWGTIFTSSTAQYDPIKCKKQEETLFKCQLSMESSSNAKQRRSMKASIIHQVLTIANNTSNIGKFRPKA